MATRVSELLATLNDQVSAKAAKISDSLGDAAASADNLDGSLKRTGQTQAQFVQNADGVQKATDRINSAFDTLEQKLERATQMYLSGTISLEKYRDMQATLVAQYERVETSQQKTIDSLRQKGATLSQVTNATGGASNAAEKHANAVKLESYQVGMLADEFHKWIDQVLAGGSALSATVYQAPNMIQAMGGVTDALSLVSAGLAGVGGVAAGIGVVAVGLGALGVAAEHEQSYLTSLSQHLRATRSDYDAMAASVEASARQIAAHSDMSLSDSRTTVETFAAVPTVDASQLTHLTQQARDLATVMNETVPDAAKTLAAAMRDPLKAAQDFAQQGVLGVDQSLVLQIQHMEESGQGLRAYMTLMDQVERATANAHTQGLTPFQESIEELSATLHEARENLTAFFAPMGTMVVQAATTAIKGLNAVWSWELQHLHLISGTGSSGNPSDAVAGSAGPVSASAPTSPSASSAWQNQNLNSWLGKSDGSVAGQYADEQRQIQGLNAALDTLNQQHAAGLVIGDKYSTALQSLNGQLNQHAIALAGLKTPYQDLIEQQGKTAASASALTGYQRAMVEADQQADDAILRSYGRHATLAEKMVAEAGSAHTLSDQYNVSTAAILRNVTAQDAIAQAWQSGGAAASHATNYWAAYNDALDHFDSKSPDFITHVNERTQALDKLSQSQISLSVAQDTSQNQDQISLINAESRSIGMNSDERAVMIAHMQKEMALRREGADLTQQSVQDDLNSVDALTRVTQAYQHQQDVLSDLTGSLSSMADTIGGDITQALVQGAGAGVNFQSALQGIESQVVTMVAKLGLINPLLNSIDGGTRNTLDDVFGLLSKGASVSSSGASESGFSIGQLFNMKRNAATSGDPFGGSGTDVNPDFRAGNDASEQITAIGHRTPLGYSTGQWAGGVLGGVAGGMSVGSMLGSIGGGTYGTVGSAAGTVLGTGLGAVLGPTIGKALGTTVGGPLGAMIGGTVLGGLGGLIGGLFAKTHYAYDSVVGSDGQLSIGSTRTKHSSDDVTAGLQDQLDAVNDTLSGLGISVSDGSYGEVGHYHKGSKKSSTDLSSLLGNIGLSSSDSTFNLALQGGLPSSFDSVSTYASTLAALKQTADTLDNLGVHVTKFDSATRVTVDHIDGYTGDLGTMLSQLDGKGISTDALTSEISTLKSLLDITDSGSESLTSQVDDLTRSYQSAARQAEQYGMDAQTLLDKGNALAAHMIATATQQLDQSDQSVQARLLAASGDQEGADLLNQQVSAGQQVQQLKDSWQSYLGDSYADNQTYQQQMTDLEKTLAAERLQIQAEYNGDSIAQQKQYLSQAQQSVASVYDNLSSYAQGLALSSASPLSMQDQYNLAKGNLTSDYQAAQGGNYDALSRIQSDAQSYLGLSQSWQGSGTGYATDYQQTLRMLQSLAGADTGALTATLAQKLTQNQVDATNGVTDAVTAMKKALQAEMKQLSRVMVAR